MPAPTTNTVLMSSLYPRENVPKDAPTDYAQREYQIESDLLSSRHVEMPHDHHRQNHRIRITKDTHRSGYWVDNFCVGTMPVLGVSRREGFPICVDRLAVETQCEHERNAVCDGEHDGDPGCPLPPSAEGACGKASVEKQNRYLRRCSRKQERTLREPGAECQILVLCRKVSIHWPDLTAIEDVMRTSSGGTSHICRSAPNHLARTIASIVNIIAKIRPGSRKASSKPNPPAFFVHRSQNLARTRIPAAICHVAAYGVIQVRRTGST